MTTLGLRYTPDVFSTFAGAQRWAENCVKLHVVILGDNEKYYVVCVSDAQRLVNAGYELAKF